MFARKTPQLWWQEQGITRFVAGVFEGGGAKGLLYRGALEAMVEDDERPCWFSAVAGASAGAITATLIAAGLEPVQVADEAAKALGTLRKPTLLSGSLRLRNGASYLDQDSLADWLSGVLELQISELSGGSVGARVTFGELYRLTRIELDVVAVDLNRQRLVIFNYELTPQCRVDEAVVASTAIPMAFEWRPLSLPQPPFGIIVDGGVMANFPTFVFKDPSFRQWAGLPPHPPGVPVVGFLLEEQDRAEVTQPDLYRESSFWPPMSQWGSVVKAIGTSGEKSLPDHFEPERRKFRPRREKPSAGAKLARALGRPLRVALWPVWKLVFDWMPAVLRWNAGNVQGNWPQPRNPVIRSLVRWFDAIIAGTRPWLFLLGGFLAASLCIGVGAYVVAWRPLAGHIGDLISGDVSIVGGIIGFVVLVVWSLVPIYAWMVLSIVFFVGWLIHRTLQMTGYGLVKTFLQGPAAPLWAGAASDDHVVRLPVPREITTLADSIDGDRLAAALEDARAATRTELRQLEFPGR
jgi:predicted acylesterase/phospholipase RssA